MSSPPQDFEVLDFEIVEENWNEYDIGDGNRLKARLVLTRLFQIFDKTQSQSESYNGEFQRFFVSYAPLANRGPPKTRKTMEELKDVQRIPSRVLSSNEKWNVYRIIKNGKIVKAKLVVDEVYRLQDEYDQMSMPSYEVTSSQLIVPAKNTKTYAQ
jgi:hypothetical protein